MLTSHVADKYLLWCVWLRPASSQPRDYNDWKTQNRGEQVSKTGRLHLAAVPVWSLSRRRSARCLAGTATSQTDEPGDRRNATTCNSTVWHDPSMSPVTPAPHANITPRTSTQSLFSKSRPTGIGNNEHVHSNLWWHAHMKTVSFICTHWWLTELYWEESFWIPLQGAYLVCAILSLDKTRLFVLSVSWGAVWTADNDRLSCLSRCRLATRWHSPSTSKYQVHKTFFFSLHTTMSMLMYHGAMKRRKWEGGHKCVWCMQGLMESTFASTLGTKQERWEGERHPSETEQSCPNGEGK